MGFFDKLAKAAKAVDRAVNSVDSSAKPLANGKKTPDGVISTGSEPIGSYKTVSSCIFDGDNADIKVKISYEIPESFTEFDSCAEPDLCGMYMGEQFDLNKPVICVTPEFYGYVDSFVKNGTVQGVDSFEKVSTGKMLFKAKADYHGQTAVFYGFEQGSATPSHMAIAVIFCKDVIGTPLENKLIKVLDHAAETYNEINQ